MKKMIVFALLATGLTACNKHHSTCDDENDQISALYDEEDGENDEALYSYDPEYEWDGDYEENEDDNWLHESNFSVSSSSGYNQYYAESDGFGNVTIHDLKGNFYYASVDDFGNVSAHDMKGHYYHSYTDDFGNTYGYDSNGNSFSSYTDDFGSTTIFY